MRVLLDECVTRYLKRDLVGHQVSTIQQNLKSFDIAILVLVAKSNTYPALKPLAPQVLQVLQTIQPGDVVRVS